MSTGLQLHHELPNLRVDIEMDKTPPYDDNINMSPIITKSNEVKMIQNDVNRTPTSRESKIPEMVLCPPAPRRPKSLVSRKRKHVDEFQFFEDIRIKKTWMRFLDPLFLGEAAHVHE
ncbi:hypothetical protein TanjilG_05172 [Lupinus angustifolius]|uniref:Uncharacterized protein n=1 Tax=Lupinus angustifolius TaxID=3871 RepID=A0A1J7GMI0_LUPAN|nr:hypothetical protein TanjilG_05172 [Lupinus angustifolius]